LREAKLIPIWLLNLETSLFTGMCKFSLLYLLLITIHITPLNLFGILFE